MSHFAVMVIGEDPEKQLAPYDENIERAPYDRGEVEQKEIQRMIDFYVREKKFQYADNFDELYAKHGKDWNDRSWQKHTDGTWHEWSTYNPDSKWDWYQLGGRWAGLIIVKEGVEHDDPEFSWGWEEEEKQKVIAERRTDQALKKDIENFDDLGTYAIVKDGRWYERGEMGWWGMTSNEKDEDVWDAECKKLLEGLPDDTLISIFDCHI